jgi:hypothetical protein
MKVFVWPRELCKGKTMTQSADRAGGDDRRRASESAAGQPDQGGSSAKAPGGRRWTPGDLWGSLQRLLSFGVMRVSSPLRKADPGESVHARARVRSARISEQYFYSQEISENATRYREKAPKGRIKLVLPYDGDRYFTRQARRDVDHAHSPGTEALIGHLVLTDVEHANMDSLLDEGPTHASVPIRARIADLASPREPDPLIADRSACVFSHDYVPDTQHFKVDPVDVDAWLRDPDDAEFSPANVASDFAGKRLQIMRQVGFLPELRLRMTVRLVIPREQAEGARAKLRQVFISWPTHTSLRSLRLLVNGKHHLLRYNPRREGLEWSDIAMALEDDPGAGELRTFVSPLMVLIIPQPGELYQEVSLDGQVKVTVNRLLSGLDARLYDATGMLGAHPRVARQSLISTTFALTLDDAFARRTLSPHQQLHFDEVIPTEARIDDVMMALKNLGFKVHDPWPGQGPEKRWLIAERAEGPDKLELVLYIEGKQHKSRRQRTVPGGMTYRTDLDSGELRIYAYGWLTRNSRPVIEEMNALREALRERFDRLPARR